MSLPHARDARGFWSRAALNRWGQPLRSWDSLGTFSRASYSAEGLPQWVEGKVADSSRVYLSYDALGRLERSYRIRPAGDTVRLDSLVYDANSRVFKRVSPLNQATTSPTIAGTHCSMILNGIFGMMGHHDPMCQRLGGSAFDRFENGQFVQMLLAFEPYALGATYETLTVITPMGFNPATIQGTIGHEEWHHWTGGEHLGPHGANSIGSHCGR